MFRLNELPHSLLLRHLLRGEMLMEEGGREGGRGRGREGGRGGGNEGVE